MTDDGTIVLHPAHVGRFVFWAGAGISIPSRMPGGAELTTRWLRHLLPDGELDALLALFARVEPVLGRSVPRLEQVIDDAVTVFGPACLATLDFFHHCPPNGLHRALARTAFENRSLVFTTNFDNALEDAGWPLGTVTPSNERVCDSGIVKVHGSIDEPLESLGHSIRNLQGGLDGRIRELLEATLQREDTVIVFLGYSGSDFLDVVPVFMDRRAPVRASALWIAYSSGLLSEVAYDDWQATLGDGAFRMLGAFDDDRRQVVIGQPAAALQRLGVAVDALSVPKPIAWDDAWDRRFRPSEQLRRLYAARIYASIGHVSGCLDQFSATAPSIEPGPQAAVVLESALNAAGYLQAAEDVRRSAQLAETVEAGQMLAKRRRLAATVRNGHPWRGLWGYLRALRRQRNQRADPASVALLAIEGATSGVEVGRSLEAYLRPWGMGSIARLCTRLWVGRCLEHQHEIRLQDPKACSHPHIVAARHRVADYLANFPGDAICWVEEKIFFRRDGLPIHDIVDDTGFDLLESDNLLGFADSERDCAERLLESVRYDPGRDEETRATMRDEARARLTMALAIGRLLGNLDLQRAVLRAHQRNPEIRGSAASARRRRQMIARLDVRLARLDRKAMHRLRAQPPLRAQITAVIIG